MAMIWTLRRRQENRASGGYCKTEVSRKLNIVMMFPARTTGMMIVIYWSTAVEPQLLCWENGTFSFGNIEFKGTTQTFAWCCEPGLKLRKTFRIRNVEELIISGTKVVKTPREVTVEKGTLYKLKMRTGEAGGESEKQGVLKTSGEEVFQMMRDLQCWVLQREVCSGSKGREFWRLGVISRLYESNFIGRFIVFVLFFNVGIYGYV